MSDSIGSVTFWIRDIKEGDREAARQLWERYFHELVAFIRKKFKSFPRRMADEEDVVLHAFDSFFRDAEQGRLPDLNDRESLWRLLIVMTSQKAFDCIRAEAAVKRTQVELPVRRAPSAEELTEFEDLWATLLNSLGHDAQGQSLQRIAIWKLENYTNAEIADQLDVSERTVERKLGLIRKAWERTVVEHNGQ